MCPAEAHSPIHGPSKLSSGYPLNLKLDFLVLGAPKAGTTRFHYLLKSHPGIAVSHPKESRFFDKHYDRGLPYLESCFSHAKPGQLLGDCSPQNLQCEFVTPKIHQHFPEARLILILREPAKRAFSHWWMHRSNGRESRSFEECVELCFKQHERFEGSSLAGEKGKERWSNFLRAPDLSKAEYLPYLQAGLYFLHLSRFLELYPRRQVLVLSFDSVCGDFETVAKKVASFLELKAEEFVEPKKIVNRGKGRLGSLLDKTSRSLGIEAWVPVSLKVALRDFLRSLGDKPIECNPTTLARLQDFYREHDSKLFELLGERFW